MSNSFTDFFETLLPREIVLYVIPASFTLGTILQIAMFIGFMSITYAL